MKNRMFFTERLCLNTHFNTQAILRELTSLIYLLQPSRKWLILSILRGVPGAGLEPARTQCAQDFKSCVSTNSTTRALRLKFIK